jgi:hypothetical protein
MGALIQTKGTQALARFFNTRFGNSPATATQTNLDFMRSISGLSDSFASGDPLWKISDAFLGKWSIDGSDVLYPTTTVITVTATASGSSTLTFTAALPTSVIVGMAIDDDSPGTTSNAIRNRTTVSTINTARTSLTISQPLTSALVAGVPIVFSNANHPNLWKRWRHYLRVDMLPATHSAIQSTIYEALLDNNFKYIEFQALESDAQKVLQATEYDLATTGQLDFNQKKKQIVLLTARTTAPHPIDRQN